MTPALDAETLAERALANHDAPRCTHLFTGEHIETNDDGDEIGRSPYSFPCTEHEGHDGEHVIGRRVREDAWRDHTRNLLASLREARAENERQAREIAAMNTTSTPLDYQQGYFLGRENTLREVLRVVMEADGTADAYERIADLPVRP